jgi:prevent-host-death family protein
VKSVNIQDAKTHLSRHLKRVKRGETLVICDRNRPVAELRPLAADKKPDRPLGALRGAVIEMAADFNEPLSPDEIVPFTQGDAGVTSK